MWISKQKLKSLENEAHNKGLFKGMDSADEADQWARIQKLEKQVKKLKKIIKKGY